MTTFAGIEEVSGDEDHTEGDLGDTEEDLGVFTTAHPEVPTFEVEVAGFQEGREEGLDHPDHPPLSKVQILEESLPRNQSSVVIG